MTSILSAMSTTSIVITVFGVVLGLALLLVLVALLVFKRLFSRPKAVYKPNAITYKMMGKELDNLNKFNAGNLVELKKLPSERITVRSDDGLTLNGYFYKCGKDTDKAVLLSHGFNSTCYNTYPAQARFYLESGFDVFMLNHRAHEQSEGAYSGFAQLEGKDLLKWLEFIINKNPDYKIVMHGNSMGAAAVMEASCLDLPKNVKCIISDCGFTSTKEELEYQMKNMFHVPAFPILNIIGFFCKAIAKFDLNGISALESVKNSKVPIMFVHGKTDATVPYSMGEACYNACGSDKKLVLYEKTGHGQSYFKNTEAYKKEMLAFTSKYMI